MNWVNPRTNVPDIIGIAHPTIAFNESGMVCIIYEQFGNNNVMCIAGRVKLTGDGVELNLGAPVRTMLPTLCLIRF